MFELGYTRSVLRPDHLLQTPETFVRTVLPGMERATAIVHASPQIGANFVQYTAEFEAEGILPATGWQRFIYVIEGELSCPGYGKLAEGGFAYFPDSDGRALNALEKSRVEVFEKRYVGAAGTKPPSFLAGSEMSTESVLLDGDPGLEVRSLLPADMGFDFAVNTMTYKPGATLPGNEIHVMEHGLLMLEGGGIYRLNDSWYPVAAGDFIWMAPYCPQWFGALGKVPSKYLIYKDWNRHPFSEVQK